MNKEYFQISHSLTLLLTTASVFLSAWTILGSIAAPGGTVFALLVLIVLALVGGQIIRLAGVALTKIFRVNISLPPLLGLDERELGRHLFFINYFFFSLLSVLQPPADKSSSGDQNPSNYFN